MQRTIKITGDSRVPFNINRQVSVVKQSVSIRSLDKINNIKLFKTIAIITSRLI